MINILHHPINPVRYSTSPVSLLPLQQQEESLEKVINDTECLFKSREKEYQETIDQIEVSGAPLHTAHVCVHFQGHVPPQEYVWPPLREAFIG